LIEEDIAMKKMLAALLAGLMLFGFGVGAGAQTPEELHAEGRALLAQTMEDLRRDYTIAGRLSPEPGGRAYYVGVVHSGDAYAFIREDGVRDIHFKERTVRVYPDRSAYHELSLSYSFGYLPLLTPKQIPGSVTVERWYESVGVSFGGIRYWYKNGSLWSIDDSSRDILINKFSKEADPDVFSLDGMQKAPELQKWLWEPQEALALFLGGRPALNNLFGKLLSAAITMLVVVFSPLLYLVILVLRVLFYFDIYKA